MALNLIKLCVGCDSIEHLAEWQKGRLAALKKRGAKLELTHTTRMVPKRVDELLDGGSLYWVIKGIVSVRQRLIAIRPFRDKEGIARCHLVYLLCALFVKLIRAMYAVITVLSLRRIGLFHCHDTYAMAAREWRQSRRAMPPSIVCPPEEAHVDSAFRQSTHCDNAPEDASCALHVAPEYHLQLSFLLS